MNSEHCSTPCKGSTASISANNTSTSIVSVHGDVFQAGLVNNSVQASFDNQHLSNYVAGKIVQVAQTESATFVLTEDGRVYEHNPNERGCDTPLREVYFPVACEEDPVVHISAGRAHVLMLTKSKKVYGYGANNKYQLVPAGECSYNYAVAIDLSYGVRVDDCPTECSSRDNYVHQGKRFSTVTPVYPNGNCCIPEQCCESDIVKQPCVVRIAAGGDTSAFADNKGRLFVLGDLVSVRENEHLYKNKCLEDLLSKTYGTVKFPADQLNCNNPTVNRNCICSSPCGGRVCSGLDLSKFNVELSLFPEVSADVCQQKKGDNLNVCDFINQLQRCKSEPTCDNTCEPCDNVTYMKTCGSVPIAIVTRKAISKIVACTGCSLSIVDVLADVNKRACLADEVLNFNFDSGRVDTTPDQNCHVVDCTNEHPIDKILLLNSGSSPANTFHIIYVDIDNGAKSIQFVESCNNTFNIRYGASAYNPTSLPVIPSNPPADTTIPFMIVGGIIPCVERTNLRKLLAECCVTQSREYMNPHDRLLAGTYLKGGDYVEIKSGCKNMATYDAPTVYCLNKRVVDLAVGDRSVYAVTSTNGCPNEVYVVGNNCWGQLGRCNNFSTLCVKNVNRCYFDCNVVRVFAGKNAAAFVTASGRVYLAGNLPGVVDCNCPTTVSCPCPTQRVVEVALTANSAVVLTASRNVYGLGGNQYGQLGCGGAKVSCKAIAVKKCEEPLAPCAPRCTTKRSCAPKKPCCGSCAQGKACESEKKHSHDKQHYRTGRLY